MNTFLARHRGTILGLVTVLGVAAMIWIDTQRGKPKTGAAAPDLTLSLLDSGEPVRLRDLKGQPAVLDFWATWCGPCRRSLPSLDALAKKYQGKARIFAVNAQDEAPGDQQQTKEQLKLTLPILKDGAMAAGAYNVEVLPTTVLLDRDGKVAASFTGSTSEETIAEAIDKLL